MLRHSTSDLAFHSNIIAWLWQASLRALNSMMAEPLPMDRFRPNIVVAGGEPWAEDNWAALQIGGIDFGVLMPCDRCKVAYCQTLTL